MITERFWTRWMVLLLSIFLLSSCGGSKSPTPSTPQVSEGSAATPYTTPLPVNTDSPHSGTVGNKSVGMSYYTTATVTPGITYTITLYGLSADADLLVYNDRPFDYILGPECASRNGSTTAEHCTVTANSTAMNIAVDGQYTSNGATYFISVNYPVATPVSCSPGPGCFDFVNNPITTAFPAPFVLTATGGVAPLLWNLDTGSALGDGNSIHSGGLNNSETSCFSYTTTTTTNSYVSFDLRVNSKVYYDLLLFYIDNVLQTPVWSGTSSQHVMFNTVTGAHTYKWCHTNNDTVTTGEVWVDNIYIQ